jgi:protein HIRA/HIR1
MLLVSLLDGQVVALRFSVPDELGPFLNDRDHGRVFQIRYGIDMMMEEQDLLLGSYSQRSGRRLLVGQTTGGTELIENPLQMSLEDNGGDKSEDDDEPNHHPVGDDDDDDQNGNQAVSRPIRDQQEETRSQGGKKRVRPVLMTLTAVAEKRPREETPPPAKETTTPSDPMKIALDAAEKASAATESAAASNREQTARNKESDSAKQAEHADASTTQRRQQPQRHELHSRPASTIQQPKIPHSKDRINTIDLPVPDQEDPLNFEQQMELVAVCTNSSKIPTGSKGTPVPCIDLVIKRNGRATWKDEITGTSCSAVAASRSILAIGTADGCVQLFGNSPRMGWTSGASFRSHPPLIFSGAIVHLKLQDTHDGGDSLDLIIVTSDGAFGVYSLLPSLSLQYKGSILPAMTHMALAASVSGGEAEIPKLSRLQVTPSGRLLLLLSYAMLPATNDRTASRAAALKVKRGVGGSIQSFVYDRPSELWLRVSDSRFVLSDFYSSLPTSGRKDSQGPLSQIDDAVKLGSLQSSLESSHRSRSYATDAMYTQAEKSGNFIASRAHCEDRLACAVALSSASEYKHWLALYVRTLAVAGDASHLRMLVDMLLGNTTNHVTTEGTESDCCWWMSSTPEVLKLDRKSLVKTVVISEMSKNRSLQRITNEVALELENLYADASTI